MNSVVCLSSSFYSMVAALFMLPLFFLFTPPPPISYNPHRGLTIMWMIVADDLGTAFHHWLDHSPWNNITFADFVFPFFLFISGLSVTLAFKRVLAEGRLNEAAFKSFKRFIKLFIIGLIVQGGDVFPFFDLHVLRIPGILQRIGFCYFCACLIEIYISKREVVSDGYFR